MIINQEEVKRQARIIELRGKIAGARAYHMALIEIDGLSDEINERYRQGDRSQGVLDLIITARNRLIAFAQAHPDYAKQNETSISDTYEVPDTAQRKVIATRETR